ncbi:MAG: type II toxin-antitoxin system HicA family toxin [Dehalococcoidia bacterium]|nr:type II toxin-antitoxin system HicA family toxin [Dehalococcoidia bacterium]
MPRWAPCKRRTFIRKLRKLGFGAPQPGGRHFYMRRGTFTLAIPSNDEFSVPQLRELLSEVELALGRAISLDDWSKL